MSAEEIQEHEHILQPLIDRTVARGIKKRTLVDRLIRVGGILTMIFGIYKLSQGIFILGIYYNTLNNNMQMWTNNITVTDSALYETVKLNAAFEAHEVKDDNLHRLITKWLVSPSEITQDERNELKASYNASINSQ